MCLHKLMLFTDEVITFVTSLEIFSPELLSNIKSISKFSAYKNNRSKLGSTLQSNGECAKEVKKQV